MLITPVAGMLGGNPNIRAKKVHRKLFIIATIYIGKLTEKE